MKEQHVIVTNPLGIHARPAAQIVQTASRFQSEVMLIKGGKKVNGKSMLGVMTLAAETGSVVTIQAEGPDEAEAVAAIAEIFSREFGDG